MKESKKEFDGKDYYVIDLLHILKAIWRRAWVVAASGVLAAVLGLIVSVCFITPKYSASIMLYVNNIGTSSSGNTTVSSSELSAAQSLVKTYGVILDNETTFERVKAEVNKNGQKLPSDITYRDFKDMIHSSSENNTEIMRVTVTCDDPQLAADIANAIYPVLEERIADIIEDASVKQVQEAIPNNVKVSPSITKFVVVGLLLGVIASAATIAVFAMLDKTVHDEEYVLQTFGCPILAKIPNLVDVSGQKHYYRRYYSHKNGDGQGTIGNASEEV